MLLDKAVAQRVSDNILSLYDWILAVLIMDMRGNILAAKSNQFFKDTFRVISRQIFKPCYLIEAADSVLFYTKDCRYNHLLIMMVSFSYGVIQEA
jgi:hypothetical protein